VIERLQLLWRRFSPLEERLLAEVRAVLPPAAWIAFDGQVAGINLVQRSPPDWSEIRYYRMRGGRPEWTDAPLFPRTDELQLATVRFSAGGRAFKATLQCIGGHIFDFSTVPGPKPVAFVSWDSVSSTRLLADPLLSSTRGSEPTPLPALWRELAARFAGHTTNWALHDERTSYRVTLPTGEYLVLGEREGDEFILFRLYPEDDRIFHAAAHDEGPTPIEQEVEAFLAGRLTMR
jgi:hypothetical protein